MKAKIGGKIMTKFATLRPKTYRYLTDDNVENKKAKSTEKWVINESVSWMISAGIFREWHILNPCKTW